MIYFLFIISMIALGLASLVNRGAQKLLDEAKARQDAIAEELAVLNPALTWSVCLDHCEYAIAEISAAGKNEQYAHGLADAAAAIRDLPMPDEDED